MLQAVGLFLRDEFRHRVALLPLGYSWVFAAIVDVSLVGIVLVSTLQRPTADWPVTIGASALALAPMVIFFVTGIKFHTGVTWVGATAATALFLFGTTTPVACDFAPMLQMLIVVVIAAVSSVPAALAASLAAAGLLTAASLTDRLDTLPLYLAFVATGWLVGYLMRTQQQLLIKQEQAHAALAQHAVADERRRIAREVHDVIAHSLSVTLLHVTGARRALQEDRDVDDALDALEDAERLGRQAMGDIRRTVGLLDNGGPAKVAPEPGVADIEALVDDFVRAGLDLSYRCDGRLDRVSAAVGLALYRITQESLANIAKHAPASKSAVLLSISPSSAQLAICNELPVTAGVTATREGRGLPGMRQRIEILGGSLTVGPGDDGWAVRAEIPLGEGDARWRPWWCVSS